MRTHVVFAWLSSLCIGAMAAPLRAQSESPSPAPTAANALPWIDEINAFGARRDHYHADRLHEFRPNESTSQSPLSDASSDQPSTANRASLTDAIATFERFVEHTPDDATYTPDALLRLSSLYHDRAELDASAAPPDAQCEIALYRLIARRFPSYRLRDAMLLLLGESLEHAGLGDEGLGAYRALVCANHASYEPRTERPPAQCAAVIAAVDSHASSAPPSSTIVPTPSRATNYAACRPMTSLADGPSRYAALTWFRIGEHHFDDATSDPHSTHLVLAIAAYEQAVRVEALQNETHTGSVSSFARYKIGWSYYRLANREHESMRSFAALLDSTPVAMTAGITESIVSAHTRGTDHTETDLATEAIVYLAIIVSDATSRSQSQSLERAIPADRWWTPLFLLQLANDYLEQTHYREAIRVYALLRARFPTHPGVSVAIANMRVAQQRQGP